MIHRNRASQLQALADETRLRILKLIGSGSPSATDINLSLNMSQPRVAHHLKILVGSGLVDARRDGRFMRYTLPTAGFEARLARVVLESLGDQGEAAAITPVRPGAERPRGGVVSRPESESRGEQPAPEPLNSPSLEMPEEPPAGIEDFLL